MINVRNDHAAGGMLSWSVLFNGHDGFLTERFERLLQAFVVEILVVTGGKSGVIERVSCKHLRSRVHRTLEVQYIVLFCKCNQQNDTEIKAR